MPNLNGVWTGSTYGTHITLVYATLTQQERRVSADVRASANNIVMRFVGEGELNEQLTLVLTEQVTEGQPATLTVRSQSVICDRFQD